MEENRCINILPKASYKICKENYWNHTLLTYETIWQEVFSLSTQWNILASEILSDRWILNCGNRINITFAGDRDITQQVWVNNLINMVFLRPHDRKHWLMQIHFFFLKSWSSQVYKCLLLRFNLWEMFFKVLA